MKRPRDVILLSAATNLIVLGIAEILLPSADKLPNVVSFVAVLLAATVTEAVLGLWVEFREPIDPRLVIACIATVGIWVAVGLIDLRGPHHDVTLVTGEYFGGAGLLGEVGQALSRRRRTQRRAKAQDAARTNQQS